MAPFIGRSLSSGLSLNPTDIDPLDRLAPPESPLEALHLVSLPSTSSSPPTIIPPHKVFGKPQHPEPVKISLTILSAASDPVSPLNSADLPTNTLSKSIFSREKWRVNSLLTQNDPS